MRSAEINSELVNLYWFVDFFRRRLRRTYLDIRYSANIENHDVLRRCAWRNAKLHLLLDDISSDMSDNIHSRLTWIKNMQRRQ